MSSHLPHPGRVAIRPFVSSDGPAVGRLIGNAEGVAELVRLAERSLSRFVVAEFDGGIASYALSYVDGSDCLLKSLVVDARCRQRGIGRDLTCDAIAWFLAQQLSRDNVIALVHQRGEIIDGFVLATLVPSPPVYDAGLTCVIDNYCVLDHDWMRLANRCWMP